MVWGGGVVVCMRWRLRWGCALVKRKAGRGDLGQNPKRSRDGSISGAPYKTVKGDGVGRWCGGVYEVVAAVGLCAHETRGREGVGTKPGNEMSWLAFGGAAQKGKR